MDVGCTNMENFHQLCIIKTKGHPVRNLECEENNFGVNEKVLTFMYPVITVGLVTQSLIEKYI